MQSGFSGKLQGVKTGMGMAKMQSGYNMGRVRNIPNKDKMQDPQVWTGINAPFIHWNSENCSVNASNNLLTVSNLSKGSNPPSLAIGSDPNRVDNSVFNGRSSIVFDSTDYISGGSLTGLNEVTFMMVFQLNTTATADMGTYIFTTIGDTIGDIYIQSVGGNAIQTTLVGNPTTNTSVYQTPPNLMSNDWYVLTAKFRLFQLNGNGSEQEVYINGTKQNIIPITTNYTGLRSDTFSNTSVFWGGNSSQTRGGNRISTGLLFKYWLNSSEQIRIENYLKWYYGYRF